MGQTADQLRQELDQKRRDLTHDVSQIEEKVKSTFDWQQQVEHNPLLATGLAVVGGFLLGNMLGGGGRSEVRAEYRPSYGYRGATPYADAGSAPQARHFNPSDGSASSQAHDDGPGFMDIVAGGVKESFRRGAGGTTFEDAMSNVSAALIGMLVDKARNVLDESMPGFTQKYDQMMNPTGQPTQASRASSLGEAARSGYRPSTAEAAPNDSDTIPNGPVVTTNPYGGGSRAASERYAGPISSAGTRPQ